LFANAIEFVDVLGQTLVYTLRHHLEPIGCFGDLAGRLPHTSKISSGAA
jgi:hypothetical protein